MNPLKDYRPKTNSLIEQMSGIKFVLKNPAPSIVLQTERRSQEKSEAENGGNHFSGDMTYGYVCISITGYTGVRRFCYQVKKQYI